MKTLYHVSIVILTTLFFSCKNTNTEKSQNNEETPDFLKQYNLTSLPIKMKGCIADGLPLVSLDSLNADIEDGSLPYCTFKTNGDYYAVIRLGIADCTLPNLITYDKTGHVIDERELAIGYCGDGPGFHCEEFASIGKDYSIYTSDTISVASINNFGEEIKGTTESYIIYKKGRLLSSGKIVLTDTIRQKIVK